MLRTILMIIGAIVVIGAIIRFVFKQVKYI